MKKLIDDEDDFGSIIQQQDCRRLCNHCDKVVYAIFKSSLSYGCYVCSECNHPMEGI